MKTDNRVKGVALAITILLLSAMYLAFNQMRVSNELEKVLTDEKLKNEKMLAEKMRLQHDIDELNSQLASYMGQNKDLDEYIKQLQKDLDGKKREIAGMNNSTATANRLKKETESLTKLKNDLEKQIAALTSENNRLMAELSRANNTIASLNDELSDRANDPDNVLKTDNYRMETLKRKNEKLTVRAKKLGKIEVSFDALSYGTDGNYRLMVRNQNGKSVDGTYAMTTSSLGGEFYADADNTMPGKVKKRVELEFSPETKLKEGIYSILVFHGEAEVGSAQIRLGK